MPSASAAAQKNWNFCCFWCCDQNRFSMPKNDVESGAAVEMNKSAGGNSPRGQSQINPGELIVIQDLEKLFGNGVKAVNGLNIRIKENTVYGLLGFNGAGKSTTINMITGIHTPTSGNIWINGVNTKTHMEEVRCQMGMCPQHNVMYNLLTVSE
eukprot:UN29506